MYETIAAVIAKMDYKDIPKDRKPILDELAAFIKQKRVNNEVVNLNFICTHNSRRSQFSQIWTAVASHFFNTEVSAFSGGVDVTALNERVVDSLKRFGFRVEVEDTENPRYRIRFADGVKPLEGFSKLVDDPVNPSANFAAVMTCSDADENCPVVFGSEKRIALRYEDPKRFDDSPLESAMYDARSFQIATELFYVFSIV